jgi:hypothetical protein
MDIIHFLTNKRGYIQHPVVAIIIGFLIGIIVGILWAKGIIPIPYKICP